MILKKLRCLSSCFLAIFPFYLTGILNNQHSLNEYNNTTTQNNSLDLKTDFQIEYTNNLNENGTQNFKSNFLYYGDNYNEANKYIFDDAIKNINTNDYVNGINEIKNGLVLYSNNQYQLNVNSYNRIKKLDYHVAKNILVLFLNVIYNTFMIEDVWKQNIMIVFLVAHLNIKML